MKRGRPKKEYNDSEIGQEAEIEVIIPYDPRPFQDEIHRNLKRYNVIVAHRRFGKSRMCINQLIYSALKSARLNPRYAYIAPTYKIAKNIVWDMLKYHTRDIPGIVKNENGLSIDFPNGARITLYGSDNVDALRGIYLDGCIIDEVAQCPKNLYPEVIRPTLVDRKGWIIFIGTPKGKGYFYKLFQKAQIKENWYAGFFPLSKTGIIDAKELAEMKEDMTPSQIAQELECSFDTTGNDSLIPLEWILACQKKKFTDAPEGLRVAGLDVARFGKDKCSVVIRQGWKILYHDSWHVEDTTYTSQRVLSLWKNNLFDILNVDGIGIGGGVVDQLRHAQVPLFEVNVALASKSDKMKALRDELWWKVRTVFENRELQIPCDAYGEELTIQLSTPTFDHVGSKVKVESKKSIRDRSGDSPDDADALCLTYSDYNVFSSSRINSAAL